jgi:predicted phage tail protein
MKRFVVYLAWAWEIVVGALLITPRGVICIACGTGLSAPGYIGRPATIVLGAGAVVLGIAGILITAVRARAVQPGAAAATAGK